MLELVREVLDHLAALNGFPAEQARPELAGRLLDGLVFNAGPGGFTAVRGACAMAQGLAMGWGKPLAAVSSLEAWAEPLLHQPLQASLPSGAGDGPALVLVLLDARMGEVYAGLFRRTPHSTAAALHALGDAVLAPDAVQGWVSMLAGGSLPDQARILVGDLSQAHPLLLARLQEEGWRFMPAEALSALDLLHVAYRHRAQRFQDPALAAPIYVRNKVALNAHEQQALRDRNHAARR